MSGRLIKDHGSWIGKGSEGSVLPLGNKMKRETSSEGFGSLSKYEDTSEDIKRQQESNRSQVNKNPQKPGHRN